MMTPTKRLSVKKPPKMMKMTKYKYMYTLFSHLGCKFTCEQTRWGVGRRVLFVFTPKANPKTRTWVQMLHLGDDPRKRE